MAVQQICQQVALVATGAAFMARTISMEVRQVVTSMVAHQAVIFMNLHIADQVNTIFKLIFHHILLPNLFMNPPHPGNKNT